MSDINTQSNTAEAKMTYESKKRQLIAQLDAMLKILNETGDQPISGPVRLNLKNALDAVNRLWPEFDQASFSYFEKANAGELAQDYREEKTTNPELKQMVDQGVLPKEDQSN